MDFTFSEMQEMLRTSARDFLKANCPAKFVRQMEADSKGFTDELWNQMGEMGWMGLGIPEEYGGAGGSFLDMAILLEEMGRVCLPGPFFSTAILGANTILEGKPEQKKKFLPEIASGKMFLTWALFEDRSVITASDIEVNAVKFGDQYLIRGTKIFVSDAHVADYIICVARTTERERAEYGISLFLVDAKSKGVQITPLKTLAGDKQYEVIFDNVAVPADNIVGRLNEGWQIVRSVAMKAMVGRCAEMVGASRHLLEITLEYIKERKAFGHPIGSFQAIQHYMADSAIAADGCSLMVYNAAWRLSQGLPAALDVSATKVLINEGFKKIAAACIQSHGAIGFTEEHDVPLYYKRAKAWEMSYGDSHDHRKRIAELSGI